LSSAGRTIRFVVMASTAMALLAIVEIAFRDRGEYPNAEKMRRASAQAAEWFQMIDQMKREKNVRSSAGNAGMLGEEYSCITTTLGSLDAKVTSANPLFAAMFARVLLECGIDSSSSVGVTISGSFPAAGISALAAIQTIGARAVVVSSLGASTYGANQPEATWIDMERWLCDRGGLQSHSSFVTLGGEGDSGGGIPEEGIAQLLRAADRCGAELFIPRTLEESIEHRYELFVKEKIAMLINIGGNQSVLGGCRHASSISNGLHRSMVSCDDSDRGLLLRIAEAGIPVFHFLNVKQLATAYRITRHHTELSDDELMPISEMRGVERLPVVLALIVLGAAVAILRPRNHRST